MPTPSSALPPMRPELLRCSWKDRICSSIARSTLRTSTPSGTASTVGAKLRMLVTPQSTSWSQTAWAACAGVAMTPIAMSELADHLGQLVDVPDHAARRSSRRSASGSASSSAAMRKPRVVKPPYPASAWPRFPTPTRRDREPAGQPEGVLDPLDQHGHVVADAAGPVRAEVGQVLAQVRRVDPGGGGQLLGRHGDHALLGQPGQHPQVDRQPGDRGLGHDPVAPAHVARRPGRQRRAHRPADHRPGPPHAARGRLARNHLVRRRSVLVGHVGTPAPCAPCTPDVGRAGALWYRLTSIRTP